MEAAQHDLLRSEGALSAFRSVVTDWSGALGVDNADLWRRPMHRPPPLSVDDVTDNVMYTTEAEGVSCESSTVNTPCTPGTSLEEERDSPVKSAEPKRRGKDIKKRKRRSYKELSDDVQMHACHFPGCTKKYVGSYGRFNLQVHIKIKHLGGQPNGQPKSPGTASTVTMCSKSDGSNSNASSPSPSPCPKRTPSRPRKGTKAAPPLLVPDKSFEPIVAGIQSAAIPPDALARTWAFNHSIQSEQPNETQYPRTDAGNIQSEQPHEIQYCHLEARSTNGGYDSAQLCGPSPSTANLVDPIVTDCLNGELFLDDDIRPHIGSMEQSYPSQSPTIYLSGLEQVEQPWTSQCNEILEVGHCFASM